MSYISSLEGPFYPLYKLSFEDDHDSINVDFGNESEIVGMYRGTVQLRPDTPTPSPIKKTRHAAQQQSEDGDDKDAIDFLNQINAPIVKKDKVVKPTIEQPLAGMPGGRGVDRFLPKHMDYSSGRAEVLPPKRHILMTPSAKSQPSGVLVPTPDGGYQFKSESNLFVARISPRGDISFERNSMVRFTGSSLSFVNPNANTEARYEAERADFLKRKDVNDVLFKMDQQSEQKKVLKAEAFLEKIWNDPNLTLKDKKDKIFACWQNTSVVIKQVVIRFINTYLPQGSANEYTKEELLSYRKGQFLPFLPYGKDKITDVTRKP